MHVLTSLVFDKDNQVIVGTKEMCSRKLGLRRILDHVDASLTSMQS